MQLRMNCFDDLFVPTDMVWLPFSFPLCSAWLIITLIAIWWSSACVLSHIQSLVLSKGSLRPTFPPFQLYVRLDSRDGRCSRCAWNSSSASNAPSVPSIPTVSLEDTPTEPATSPRTIEVPVQRCVEELRLPTREIGPRDRKVCVWEELLVWTQGSSSLYVWCRLVGPQSRSSRLHIITHHLFMCWKEIFSNEFATSIDLVDELYALQVKNLEDAHHHVSVCIMAWGLGDQACRSRWGLSTHWTKRSHTCPHECWKTSPDYYWQHILDWMGGYNQRVGSPSTNGLTFAARSETRTKALGLTDAGVRDRPQKTLLPPVTEHWTQNNRS